MSTQIVSFKCILKSRTGQFISATFNRDILIARFEGAPLNGLVRGLQNLISGEKRTVVLPAAEAYGYYDPAKILLLPRASLPAGIRLGARVRAADASGDLREYRVTELRTDQAALDANHLLAGQDLIFEIEVVSVRDAEAGDFQDPHHLAAARMNH